MDKPVPVLHLEDFQKLPETFEFYANKLNSHVQNHAIANIPHKHDFYFIVLFTSGSGTHEIDFQKHVIKKGSLFVMKPGQMHTWKLSKDIDGYVFFHSRKFYDQGFTDAGINNFPFYNSSRSSPHIRLSGSQLSVVEPIMSMLVKEYGWDLPLKSRKIRTLLDLVYIELSRLYEPIVNTNQEQYLEKLREFENLIDAHFKEFHSAGDYAEMLSISQKHLNRITQACVQKTSTQLIGERIILEAQRMLIHRKKTIKEISDKLGYKDVPYFIRFFRKHTGKTPVQFAKSYR